MVKRGKHERGFTLMEVIVVATIMAILASIAFVGVGQANRFSQRRNCETDVRSVMAGMASYSNDWQAIPSATATPININPYATASPTATPPENIVPNYLARLAPAATGSSSGQSYSIGGRMTGNADTSWDYYVTVAKAPTPATTVTVVPSPTATPVAPTYALWDVAKACSAVLP